MKPLCRFDFNELEKADKASKMMIDMSHGNSKKQFKRQLIVNKDISNQISSGEIAFLEL